MKLTLTILRGPEDLPPESRVIEGGEYSIGRGSDNDWVLADPNRHLSKRHCVLAWRSGGWQVLDTSANGTYHNADAAAVGAGGGRDLSDGDRLRLGPYEIEVRMAEVAKPPPARNPFASDVATGAAIPPPRPQPAPTGHPAEGLLAAFLAGAGMVNTAPADPDATMRALGRSFRAMVSGLRQAIMARAEIKGAFRIERTAIRARGNNPLKFSADDDDALAALIGIGRATEADPAKAVAEALRDIRRHEQAMVQAMQEAVQALLAAFDPETLRAKADEASGLAVVSAQRKARAWDLFEKLHEETANALADDFDSVFGRAFARAYEQALREAK